MAKLPRIAQKIFCGNAQPTETAVFGTMKTSSPQYTGDVKTLMSSAAYGQGWSSAVEENFAPFLEELNGVQKGLSQQTGYILQEGIPEYDAETTYYKGSIVKVVDGINYYVYWCIVDETLNVDPTNTDNWKFLYSSAAGIQNLINMEQVLSTSANKYPSSKAVYDATKSSGNPVGTIIAWPTTTAPAGYLICDGSAISRTTYAALFAVIGTTFGEGDGNSTFNLPNKSFLTGGVVGNGSLGVSDGVSEGYLTGSADIGFVSSNSNPYQSSSPAAGTNTTSWRLTGAANKTFRVMSDKIKSGLICTTDSNIRYCIKY
mgnify:CR=1 FL=1